MAYENNAFALIGHFAEYLHYLILCIAVKVSCRLVLEDYIGIVGQSPG